MFYKQTVIDSRMVYGFTDYKKFLAHKIKENSQTRGYQSLLSTAAGCHRSFISQVLSGHVHLTPEHALGLAVFWRFDADATEYFLDLVALGRAGTPALRAHLEARLKTFRTRHRNKEVRIEHPSLSELEHQATYYSHWYWSAIHMLVGTERHRSEQAMSEKLHLPVAMVRQTLSALEAMGLVAKSKQGWISTRKNIHAPQDSIFSWLHHGSWRAKANESMRQKSPKGVHFTGVYSLSRRDRERIENLTVELMGSVNKIVGPSPEEDVACLCLDWFEP